MYVCCDVSGQFHTAFSSTRTLCTISLLSELIVVNKTAVKVSMETLEGGLFVHNLRYDALKPAPIFLVELPSICNIATTTTHQ